VSKLHKLRNILIVAILILLLIYLASRVSFIFTPIISLFNIVIVPVMLAGLFYYLLRPLIALMERKIKRTFAILIVFAVAALLVGGFILGIWPLLRDQVVYLLEFAPSMLTKFGLQLKELEESSLLAGILPEDVNLSNSLTEYLGKGFTFVTGYMSGLFSFVSSFAIVLFVFPIILFYMLKEGGKMGSLIVSALPKRFRSEGTQIMGEIDKSLSGFIVGRVVVNLALGVLMYIGFLAIKLPFALLLTVVAVILNFIPFIGAIVSSVPIIIIGLVQSPSTAIWALVIILLSQQIQDNIIAPYVFRKQLDVHPLTVIFLVLLGAEMTGIVGVILIIPVYMIIKIVLVKVYELFVKQHWENA
jgi:predicted PurR-regulated permease PerM